MNEPVRSTAGGGCLIALAIFAGVAIGLWMHQPTIGFLTGLVIGVLAALWVWQTDKN